MNCTTRGRVLFEGLVRSFFSGHRDRGRCGVSLVHSFAPSPTGGGHQFLRALCNQLDQCGVAVTVNFAVPSTKAILINSFNFEECLLRLARYRGKCRVVHRVDGPLQTYRGFDDGTDARIVEYNRKYADASVFQSLFSREESERLGLDLRPGPIISNAADPAFFRQRVPTSPPSDRPLQVIATSWSDNPRKGLEVFRWLDENLDPRLAEVTFVGRIQAEIRNLRHLPPCPSEELAAELRNHDVFLAASENDPCSNSLTEALTVGLPVAFRKSGGHPELVGGAGIGFDRPEELPGIFGVLRGEWRSYRERIAVPSIQSVARHYLEVLRVDGESLQSE